MNLGFLQGNCGTAGKVDNCQVGVFAAYASKRGYALVDKRLFIPEQWFSEEYRERRQKCNLPEDTVFMTKPQLATEIMKKHSLETLLEQIAWIQARNHRACLSHRRKRLREISEFT